MTTAEDLRSTILDCLSKMKEEERINYLIDCLIEAKLKIKAESEEREKAQKQANLVSGLVVQRTHMTSTCLYITYVYINRIHLYILYISMHIIYINI